MILTCLLLAIIQPGFSQTITKYYDADMMETIPGKATFYSNFEKLDNGFAATTYWKANGKVRSKGVYPDTVIANHTGLQVTYYKTGKMEDSIYSENGVYKYLYHYDPSGKLIVRHYTPEGEKEAVTEGYDEDGKKIKKFMLFKEAEFKGGQSAWEKHITRKGAKDLDVKGEIPASATAYVKFIIDEDGAVVNARIHKSSGLKEVDRDALQVIGESPLWKPAIKYNVPVRAFRIQPVTYNMVTDKNSKSKQ